MTITNITIDDGCTVCGLCEQICPDVFEMGEIAKVLRGVDYDQYEDQIKEAVDSCPVSVIKVS